MNGHASNNALIKRFSDISNMRSIQDNPLLNSRATQQPKNIREVILGQRKIDNKIDAGNFDRLLHTASSNYVHEREKMWKDRTNQPYKNIIDIRAPASISSRDDLVIYRVNDNDKNEKIFDEDAKKIKCEIATQDRELRKIYSQSERERHQKTFLYNHKLRFESVEYNPADKEDMKNEMVEHYKKEQKEAEIYNAIVDNSIDELVSSNV